MKSGENEHIWVKTQSSVYVCIHQKLKLSSENCWSAREMDTKLYLFIWYMLRTWLSGYHDNHKDEQMWIAIQSSEFEFIQQKSSIGFVVGSLQISGNI